MDIEFEELAAQAQRIASGVVALEQQPELFDAVREEARRLLQQMAARRLAADVEASTGGE